MVFLWVVPALAATVAAALVLGRARTLETLSVELLMAVHRTRELRVPLSAVRDELGRTGPVSVRVWTHWADRAPDADPPVGS